MTNLNCSTKLLNISQNKSLKTFLLVSDLQIRDANKYSKASIEQNTKSFLGQTLWNSIDPRVKNFERKE